MKFGIPKRIYIDRTKAKKSPEPVGFRLPKHLLEELETVGDEYGYQSSLFVSLILDGYLSQIQLTTKIKYPTDLEKKALTAVSYRLDRTLYAALQAAAGSRSLTSGDLLAIAIWTFLKAC